MGKLITAQEIKQDIDKAHSCVYDQVFYRGVVGLVTARYQRQLRKSLVGKCGTRVLELGAGKLHLTRSVQPFLETDQDLLVALDIRLPKSPSGTSRNYDFNPGGAGFCCGDASSLPFRTETIDLIFHGCLLHHVERPLELMTEARRVVKPAGRIVYYLPCHPGLAIRIYQRLISSRIFDGALKEAGIGRGVTFAISEAVEHRNHYLSLREMIRFVHAADEVAVRRVPLLSPSWHLRAYEIYTVERSR